MFYTAEDGMTICAALDISTLTTLALVGHAERYRTWQEPSCERVVQYCRCVERITGIDTSVMARDLEDAIGAGIDEQDAELSTLEDVIDKLENRIFAS